jgi:hypothetical protein
MIFFAPGFDLFSHQIKSVRNYKIYHGQYSIFLCSLRTTSPIESGTGDV